MARHRRKGRVDVGLEIGVAKAHRVGVLEHHLAHAVGGEDAEAMAGERSAAVGQHHLLRRHRAMKPTVILIGADKGGVGKTTLSRALLDFIARKDVPARAFDTEFPRGSLKRFHPDITESSISPMSPTR
jgi:2-phosphoglycerate kinase